MLKHLAVWMALLGCVVAATFHTDLLGEPVPAKARPVADFRLQDPRDQTAVVLSDLKERKAIVIIFLGVVAGVLLTRSRGAKAQPQEASPSKADYRIKEVHLQEEDRGRGSWQLDADYGEVFEAQGKTYMKKVTIRINEPTREWTVNSDEGDLLRESKDVELRGNVVVVSSDGLRLETTRLNYMAKDQRVWTDQPVKIWRNGVVVEGTGFESGAKDGVTKIKGRVRATISRDQVARAEEKKP